MRSAEDVVGGLLRRGDLWEAAPGLVGLAGEALALYRQLERRIEALAARETTVEWRVPQAITFETLARAEYFASFPQWLTAASHLSDDPATLERVATAPDPAAEARRAVEPPTAALAPALCYHAYAALAGRTLEQPVVLTTQGTCWRHEGERLTPLERGWAFTMREIVCFGTTEEVEEFRQRGMARTTRLARSLGLEPSVELATDPFFAPTARGKELLQRVKSLKHEMLLAVGPQRRIAAASFNHHETFFGRAFDVRLRDGSPASTGCLAFGLERWLLAYLCAHQGSDWVTASGPAIRTLMEETRT